MSVKGAQCKVMKCFLIIRLSVPAIIIAISEILLCLPVPAIRSHFIVLHCKFKALLKPSIAVIVLSTEIIHGGCISSFNLIHVKIRKILDYLRSPFSRPVTTR